MRIKALLAFGLLTLPAAAVGQNLPALNILLDRLDAYAKQYQASLPSLECDEQIVSQSLNARGKVAWQVKTRSILREIRTGDVYDPFVERRVFKSVDGHRPWGFQTGDMPYFVQGGFGSLVGFKRWQQRECFDYAVTSPDNGRTVRLEMTLKAKPASPACAKIPWGFHRIVIAEPDTGRILHAERTINPRLAEKNDDAYFGGIDYAPQKLGDQVFWLPARFYAHDAANRGSMVATYSNYHRYTGELKILP